MKGAIEYRGPGGPCWLMPGSQAHKLATEGKRKQLEQHMREVHARSQQLTGEGQAAGGNIALVETEKGNP